jgi:hypothetical protein
LTTFVIREKKTGLYLRQSRFDPQTQQPWTGPITQSWFPERLYPEQAFMQVALLGVEDWEVCLYHVGPEPALTAMEIFQCAYDDRVQRERAAAEARPAESMSLGTEGLQ